MKITAIKQQIKQPSRYSIFVEGKYGFSLSDTALLENKLVTGLELNEQRVRELKQASADDKLYSNTLRYVAIRPRTQWEAEQYLKRKNASPTLTNMILNRLSNFGLVDDEKFARALINDRQLLRPTSRRKLLLELRQKHVDDQVVQKVITGLEPKDELTALLAVIAKKRRLSRYQDNLKLMQYLSRQGFNYDDIKQAMRKEQ